MKKPDAWLDAANSPVGNVARTVRYDPDGVPYATEWSSCEPKMQLPVAGLAAVASLRPDGCGEEIVWGFAKRGLHVVTCDRNEEAGKDAVRRLTARGASVSFCKADVSTPAGVHKFMDEIARWGKRLNVLVCNIGNARNPKKDNILDIGLDEIWELLADNLVAPVLLTQVAVRRFLIPQGEGSVIYLGTNNGQRGMGVRGQLIYGAAKTALTSIVANCTAQLGRTIRFNLVRPGVVETNSENWQRRKRDNPNWPQLEAESVPAGVLARPEDIANAIAWLASDEARYVQGIELAVDGGESATGVMFRNWDPTDFRASYVSSIDPMSQAKKAA